MILLWSVTLVVLLSNFCYGDAEGENEDSSPPSRLLTLSEVGYFAHTYEGQGDVKKEFMKIKGGQRKPWTEALKPENVKKNRYPDLLAYDETRVILKPSYEGQTSDYINANYINGTNGDKKEYIATQGPLENTVNDFWAMVWQENANKIVALAKLFEKNESKVFQYWPEKEGTYGNITVKLISEQPMDTIEQVMRSFVLEKGGVRRDVRQYHYTGWPDLGVPNGTFEVLGLMRQARIGKPDRTGPIIIHCSAGVGRTGTVILLDSMIEKAKREGVVNIPARLNQMRLQRVDVVEKPDQYKFAYEAVSEAFAPATAEFMANVDKLYTDGVWTEFEELDSDQFDKTSPIPELLIEESDGNHEVIV